MQINNFLISTLFLKNLLERLEDVISLAVDSCSNSGLKPQDLSKLYMEYLSYKNDLET
jgi:hypothetical protein